MHIIPTVTIATAIIKAKVSINAIMMPAKEKDIILILCDFTIGQVKHTKWILRSRPININIGEWECYLNDMINKISLWK